MSGTSRENSPPLGLERPGPAGGGGWRWWRSCGDPEVEQDYQAGFDGGWGSLRVHVVSGLPPEDILETYILLTNSNIAFLDLTGAAGPVRGD
jgi:hypothetical protein